jgi:hypothetical protein
MRFCETSGLAVPAFDTVDAANVTDNGAGR